MPKPLPAREAKGTTVSVKREAQAPWLGDLRAIHRRMGDVSEAEVHAAIEADEADEADQTAERTDDASSREQLTADQGAA